MTKLFTTVLNMSITASYVALAVMAVRMLIKRLPKAFSYALWLAVLVRLVCPLSFQSAFSFLSLLGAQRGGTGPMEYVPHNLGLMRTPAVDVGITAINQVVNASLPSATPTTSINPMQLHLTIASVVWAVGAALLIICAVVSTLGLRVRLETATLVSGNVFATDRVTTPFVYGLIKPKIIIPIGISPSDQAYVVTHEQTHIQRLDHLIKPLAYLVICVHWFNPLIWLSFALMSRDMEMSCDESVIALMGGHAKRGYSSSLLAMSVQGSGLIMSPLAFSESDLKSRIKNILNYRRPVLWIVVVAVVAMASLFASLTANPLDHGPDPGNLYLGYKLDDLIRNKTPYVGDNSKVSALVRAIPLPKGIKRDTIELHTAVQPYGLTINLNMVDASGIKVNDTITGDVFRQSSLLLFSLIDNVDFIHYTIYDQTGEHDGASYSFTFTRAAIDQMLGEDVRRYAADTSSLSALIGRLGDLPSGPTTAPIQKADLPELDAEDVAAARAVVEEYYRATAAKDDAAIIATLHPHVYGSLERVKNGNVILYDTEKRTLLTIDYSSQDEKRGTYRPGGKEIAPENIIVFKASFNIEYPLKDGGPWNEGIYANWSMILVRDDQNSPWLIYDQGY